MSITIRTIAILVTGAVMASCASSGTGSTRAHVKAPELITTSRPELVVSGVTPNAPRPTNVVQLQVVVNTEGRADLSTLKLSGPGAELNRNALTTWLREARFKPGIQDGQPVSAMFRTSFGAMTRTIRTQ